jgi:hypothetical protein
MHEDSYRMDGPEDKDAGSEVVSPKPRLPWGKIVGGVAVAMSGTVVATLAATHKSARHENAKAYVRGMNDMLKSARQSIRDGVDPFNI